MLYSQLNHVTRGFPVASFTKEVNPRLAKRPLKINGRLANLELASLLKEATAGVLNSEKLHHILMKCIHSFIYEPRMIIVACNIQNDDLLNYIL